MKCRCRRTIKSGAGMRCFLRFYSCMQFEGVVIIVFLNYVITGCTAGYAVDL